MEIKSLGGALYFLLLKDDYSHYRTVYFLKKKDEVKEKIIEFVRLTHHQTNNTNNRIKVVRSDCGGEFVNKDLKQFYANEGIKQVTTIPRTPEQNGTVERDNRTIVEAARTLLHAHSLEKHLWAEAVNASVYVLNCTGTSTVEDKTPYQLWFNKDVNIDKLKEFGSIVYAHIPKVCRKKFDKKTVKCVLVGYCDNGYRVYNPRTKQVQVPRDLVFGKNEKDTKQTVSSVKVDKMPNKKSDEQESVVLKFFKEKENDSDELLHDTQSESSNDSEVTVVGANEVLSDESDNNLSTSNQNVNAESTVIDHSETLRSGSEICDLTQRNVIDERLRSRAISDAMYTAMLAIYEPQTYDDAMKSPEKQQ